MTDLRKAAKMALEALQGIHVGNMTPMAEENWNKALTALRQALAQPEQEPIHAWLENDFAFKAIMKWADIYAAQTGEIYAQAALDSSKTATMAKERETLAFVVASHTSPISEPVKERISEPLANQEPVAWITRRTGDGGVVLSGYETCEPTDYDSIPVYTAPPRKPWVGLTDEEIKDIWINTWKITEATDAFAYAIEAKLKEKNT